ncbi:putative helicase MOV-10 isoform X2 [Ooceraea biroi]|uniref:putative helicase MOV-10 isoform X2 n=1 Tax=Ooceraea biroi TaxID=2015173 RepID=UPI0005BC62B4|nr:putative helicase MOV-10 isoform X2 [Ooceraea biroi]
MQGKEKWNSNYASCTVSQQMQLFKLPSIPIPQHLRLAMQQIWMPDVFRFSGKCDNYVKCIESLFQLKKIESQNYLAILKICLYLEQYVLDLEIARHKLTDHNIQKSKDLKECFIISLSSLNDNNSVIMPDDEVTLYEAVTKRAVLAKVVVVAGNDVTIKLCNPYDAAMLKHMKFDINFQSQHWPMRCCHYALMVTSHHKWIPVMYPELKPGYTYLEYDIDDWINPNISENKEQKQAVRSILNKTAHPAPYIIFGPPGTGKTATLVESICQILIQQPTTYILVCTGSNAAADEITKRLIKYVPQNIIYRMYAPSRAWSTVDKKIQPCANFVNNSTIFLAKDILLLKRIVITTLVTSIRLIGLSFRENHFSYVFIDEASQATEPEMLIPLTITSNLNEINSAKFQAQIVIAGDPYQLGPVVHCKEIKHLYGISMLERLMKDCSPYKKQSGKYNPNYITKLLKNYRTHESIFHISNKEFYENELKSCGGDDTRMALDWSELPNKNFPMIFQEVLGHEERCSNMSVFNKAEVLVVVKYVNMLVGTKFGKRTLTQEDIGIITPFKQQQLEIIYQLAMIRKERIAVGTVETFQGQERPVIILSTRFNVAMTRAKALMIIIGNPHVISTNKYWRLLWEYCREHGSYIPFARCPLKPRILAQLISNDELRLSDNASNVKKLSVTVNLGKTKNENKVTRTLDNVLVRTMKDLTL